jgi:hypothetical protein
MAVQANRSHCYKVERVEEREVNHHPDTDEFRANAPGYG